MREVVLQIRPLFFDFYISAKYVSPQLIRLEDAMFHLFLRKNLNTRNPEWKMPSIRQMMRRLSISQRKLDGIIYNLTNAHLLTKETGYRKGELGKNVQNAYILSDPIQTLAEFIAVAQEALFPYPLRDEWKLLAPNDAVSSDLGSTPCTRDAYTPVRVEHTDPVRVEHTYKQTSSFKQTSEKQTINPFWEKVLADFKMQLPQKTFQMFLAGTDLVAIEEDVAVISITNGYAKDWLEHRLANKIKYALQVEGVRVVVLTE